jgi:nitroreductase
METWDAIRARRDVRKYSEDAVAREDLERILEAGRRAPSSMNWQPWHFVVVTDRKRLQQLSTTGPGTGHVAGSAVTVALAAYHPEDDVHSRWMLYDFGQVTANMMLAAADLGIGSGHAGVRDQHDVRQILGLPDDTVCPYMVAFGYPAGRPLRPLTKPDRRPFDEVVHWERW